MAQRGESLNKRVHTTKTIHLWKRDMRLGIALDPERRVAEEGRIYTSEGIAMHRDFKKDESAGFLVFVMGADGFVPDAGLVRFGGDGRGSRIVTCTANLPEPDWDRISEEKRFKVVLTAPGLFERGWMLPGLEDDCVTWHGPEGITARLVSAAVPRAQVVSGWDLAREEPKEALRAAPIGSVYWFETTETDSATLVTALKRLVAEGLGIISAYPDKARLSEGFNNIMVACWATGSE